MAGRALDFAPGKLLVALHMLLTMRAGKLEVAHKVVVAGWMRLLAEAAKSSSFFFRPGAVRAPHEALYTCLSTLSVYESYSFFTR